MCYTELRLILGPQRCKVDVKADLAATVHLESLAVELGQLQVHWRVRVGRRDLEAQIELPLHELMYDPAFACPDRALRVRFNLYPIIVFLLIHSDVFDQHHVLFLEPCNPLGITRSCRAAYQGQALD